MGANTDFRRYKDSLGREEIKKLWKDAVEQSLREDGHSYSGAIGMLGTEIKDWRDLNKTEVGAYDYIETYQEKWDPPWAVSYVKDATKYWLIGGWCSS